jgi:gas vesicle protein
MKARMIILSLATLVLGGLVGTSVALLYAPQSGRATRAMLRSKGVILQEKVSEEVDLTRLQMKGRINNMANEARGRVNELGGHLKDSVSSIPMALRARAH